MPQTRFPTRALTLLTCALLSPVSPFPKDVYKPSYRWIEAGDVNIGAILSIHSSSSLFNCTTHIQDTRNVQTVEAMNFAIREINDNPNLLPDLKLGFVILDDCLSPSMALARAIQFMPSDERDKSRCNGTSCVPSNPMNDLFYNVVGVIGTYTSKLSIIVANVLNLFHLPQISHTATSDVLSDKTRFPYFFRMVPPDRYQGMVILKILKRFNWSHVAIVYSDGTYGREGVKTLQNLLKSDKSNYSVCIEDIKEINYGSDVKQIHDILKDLNSNSDVKVVIAFVEIEDAYLIGKSVEESGLSGRFVWIGSDSVSFTLEEHPSMCQHLDGSIVVQVQPHLETVGRFRNHLSELQNGEGTIKSGNPWLRELQESQAGGGDRGSVNMSLPSGGRDLLPEPWSFDNEDGYNLGSALVDSCLIDSVYAFALAIQNVVDKRCKAYMRLTDESLSDCVMRVGIYTELKNINFNDMSGAFKFDENGDVLSKYEIRQCSSIGGPSLNKIGIWDMTSEDLEISTANLSWTDSDIPTASCPRHCTETKGSIYYFPKKGCCWQCIKCKVNEIVAENATRCLPCEELFWPDTDTQTSCIQISPFHFGLQHTVSIGLCTCAIAGILVCVWISATLIKYRDEHVIRCISLELTSMILIGTMLTFALTVSFLSQPNGTKCYVNHVGFSLTFTIIYAPLLIKTNRLYRIFNAGRRTTRKPVFISKSSQVLISLLLVFIQVAIVIVSTSLEPPRVKLEMPSRTEKFVDMFCKLPRSGLLASLSYNLVPVMICTFYAFRPASFLVAIVIVSTSLEPPRVKLEMPSRTEKFVEMFCKLPRSGLLASLSYNLVLVMICTFYAFKTRKLPDNYKESRYIAYCVDTTLLIWVTFVPTYLTTSRAAAKVTIVGVSLVLNASVIVTCLFIPRLYSLYKSLKNACPKNGHHYKDFRIVKHVVQRKRSNDLNMVEVDRERSKRIPSAVTIMSDIMTHEFNDVIVAVTENTAPSCVSSDSSGSGRIPEVDVPTKVTLSRKSPSI